MQNYDVGTQQLLKIMFSCQEIEGWKNLTKELSKTIKNDTLDCQKIGYWGDKPIGSLHKASGENLINFEVQSNNVEHTEYVETKANDLVLTIP